MKTYNFFDKKISGPFTIPSGIVITEVPMIKKVADEIPEIGIITTKSIGAEPRKGNREPILAQYAPFSFINAVGLTNPGADEFAKQLAGTTIPADRFLLVSLFGAKPEEFKNVAQKLYEYADGFELNVSCPHSQEYGQSVGRFKEIVRGSVQEVASLGKPVLVKVSPNLDVREMVRFAIDGGASGFTAINTRGPEEYLYDSHLVLSNKVGGVSGRAILELGLKSVAQIRDITSLPIIGCGGIATAKEIIQYQTAGANFFGVGSALAGMDIEMMKEYFRCLLNDFEEGSDRARVFVKENVKMNYQRYLVKENQRLADDLFILKLSGGIEAQPGQFVFCWLPQIGEKPFSILDDEPLSLLIKEKGCFTQALSKLEVGDVLYARGPYGNSPEIKGKTLLVGGGTGIAALYLFAKKNPNTAAILGASDKNRLAWIEKFKEKCQQVYLTTQSGEVGHQGVVTDVIERAIKETKPEYCLNCGPEPMVRAALEKEKLFINPENIYSSIEFLTKCGVGLCGSCATSKGYRNCVDGTFFNPEQIF